MVSDNAGEKRALSHALNPQASWYICVYFEMVSTISLVNSRPLIDVIFFL